MYIELCFPRIHACKILTSSALTDVFTQVRFYFTVYPVEDVEQSGERVGPRETMCGKEEGRGPTVDKKWNLVSQALAMISNMEKTLWPNTSVGQTIHSRSCAGCHYLQSRKHTQLRKTDTHSILKLALYQIPLQKTEGHTHHLELCSLSNSTSKDRRTTCMTLLEARKQLWGPRYWCIKMKPKQDKDKAKTDILPGLELGPPILWL